jgi:hypothetical protein
MCQPLEYNLFDDSHPVFFPKKKQEINVSAVTAYNLFDDSQPEKMGPAFSWHSANLHAAMAEHANRHHIQVVPYVSPGYDDRKMRGGTRPVIDRSLGAQYVFAWLQMLWFIKCQGHRGGKGRGGGRPAVRLGSD